MKEYYHKYFEDYREERVLDRDGKGTHIERSYVGYYFRAGETRAARILLRVWYLIMGAAALGCLMFAATRTAHCNTAIYSVVLQTVTLLLFLWFLWVLANYVTAPEFMTIYKYKSTSLQMIRSCRWLLAAFLLNGAAAAIDTAIFYGQSSREQFLAVAAYVIGGVLTFALLETECGLPYERFSNDKEIVWSRQKREWRKLDNGIEGWSRKAEN